MKSIISALGIAMIMTACSRPSEEQDSLKNFARQASELQQGLSAKGAEWEQRLGSLSMGDVLLPDKLVTPEGRASGRATLKQFRALIAERAATRKDASIKLQQIIAAIPDEEVRDSARAGVNAHHEESVKSAQDMDQAQLQLADAYDAIINWCEGEGKRLTAKENQLSLSTPAQQTQLDSLLAKLKAAEKRENEAVSRMEDLQRKSQRR
jgi:hypothetical protein